MDGVLNNYLIFRSFLDEIKSKGYELGEYKEKSKLNNLLHSFYSDEEFSHKFFLDNINDQELFIKNKKINSIHNLDIEDIKKDMNISPFGDLKTNETIIDESVRKAYEIKHPDFSLCKTDDINSYVEEIENYLTNFLNRKIKCIINKLNLYESVVFLKHIEIHIYILI